MNINILIADDDDILRELLCDILEKQGYTSIEACNGEQAIEIYLNKPDIDLVILDVMMPVFDGWEVLSQIRQLSDVPVVMLTALGDEIHEVKGLRRGADDYISKPFSYEILTARIDVLLRKVKKEKTSDIIIDGLKINRSAHKVFIDESEIILNNKEYNLLIFLIDNKNIVMSRDKILYSVWGYDFEGDERTIDTHIKTLRSKLLTYGNYIKTVRGSGYVFEI